MFIKVMAFAKFVAFVMDKGSYKRLEKGLDKGLEKELDKEIGLA
ncbi:MAG: hypothetical protein RLZZ335_246 [Bacteroidota bacterium]|jgi:hypothetical protein